MGDTTHQRRSRQPSGKFVLRIAPGLHAALREAAREAGMSLNDYCARKLGAPAGGFASVPGAAAVVERAGELFGNDLMAIVVYGSWSRGEATAGSDLDVLIVLEVNAPITRAIYRTWDARPPLTWDGHVVEPHFVHLHEKDAGTMGSWAEAAIDGIVIYERDLRVSRRLADIRRDIVAGRLVRRVVHGQPYWSEVA